ncbi:MAG TPA: EamA family transporter RarD [Anaeromyxobacteraceae bacterium]|nr:EamA family transporter RarD [Anaeromyxobacteraceae bacterium]
MSPHRNEPAVGVAYAAAAYLTWGAFPIYFHALGGVPAPQVLAHRILWSTLFLVLLVTARQGWREVVPELRVPGTVPALGASATLIAANWLIYIWSVNSGHVLDASLGYFVNPLVMVVLGVVVQRDHLTRLQAAAVSVAALGVLLLVAWGHRVPWIALGLATTFGLYGLVRKRVRVSAVAGLLCEVALLAPLAALYLAWVASRGENAFGSGIRVTVLLAASGVVTAIPLIWFALGVQRLRLSTVGLLQYLNPTTQFLIAVFAFGEPFTRANAVAFACIWASLALYTADALARGRRADAE